MKKRADILLVDLGISKSRSQAADLIKRGEVTVDGKIITKPSVDVSPTSLIEIRNPIRYVGRGGLKLEHALTHWKIDVQNKTAIDIGSSTGGFTDCLLQHGAKKVFAVDVGSDQFDSTLRSHPQIELFEQTDIRNFVVPHKIDIAVIDVSFISITKLITHIKSFLTESGILIALIKPQFEVGKEYINKKGLVKTDEMRQKAIEIVNKSAKENSFHIHGIIDSPVTGGSGNKEFLLYATLSQ